MGTLARLGGLGGDWRLGNDVPRASQYFSSPRSPPGSSILGLRVYPNGDKSSPSGAVPSPRHWLLVLDTPITKCRILDAFRFCTSIMASWVGLDSLYSPTLIVCTTILFYLVAGTFYRLYLSPLAKFPGPKLAAVTLWYEAWYDVIKEGQYSFEIGRMHEKYGTSTIASNNSKHECLRRLRPNCENKSIRASYQ